MFKLDLEKAEELEIELPISGGSLKKQEFQKKHLLLLYWLRMWELDCKESWTLKIWCFWTVLLKKMLESPLDCKEIQPVHSKDQSWVFFGRNDAKAETPILWPPHVKSWLIGKKPWCWEGLGAGGEGDGRGWDGWMASPTRWTWVWVDCGSWWWTGRPCVLRFMGLQRVGLDWVTKLNWTELSLSCIGLFVFEIFFSQASRLSSFLLLVSALLSLVQWFVLSFCLFVFPLMGKAEWGNPVC